jgi:flagellar hook-basal body complex protein FliE
MPMPMSIHSIGIPQSIPDIKVPAGKGGDAAQKGAFHEALAEAVEKVEDYRKVSEAGVQQFLRGDREDLHSVALQTQKAELAFELFLQTRNKVVQAYQEVMRTQV